MARLRHDSNARGLIYEPFWEWLKAGQPDTEEARRHHFTGYSWWLDYMHTGHWGLCYECGGESIPERVMRLLTVAVNEGLVGMADDEQVGLDDGNCKAIIRILDETEAAPTREWWHKHYGECPARKEMLKQVRATLEKAI
jgi:hypothetical protein